MASTKFAGFRTRAYKTLQAEARKTAHFQRKINAMGVVQGELRKQLEDRLSELGGR